VKLKHPISLLICTVNLSERACCSVLEKESCVRLPNKVPMSFLHIKLDKLYPICFSDGCIVHCLTRRGQSGLMLLQEWGKGWVEGVEAERGVTITKLTDSAFWSQLESAVQNGRPILVQVQCEHPLRSIMCVHSREEGERARYWQCHGCCLFEPSTETHVLHH
jgi:hypothetical protein